jgi:hypothetical protein
MKRFVEGTDRGQATLFPECLADWIDENNPVQVIDVFVDELDLAALGFDGVSPEATGRPSYHPSVLLKLYIYGYLVTGHVFLVLDARAVGVISRGRTVPSIGSPDFPTDMWAPLDAANLEHLVPTNVFSVQWADDRIAEMMAFRVISFRRGEWERALGE